MMGAASRQDREEIQALLKEKGGLMLAVDISVSGILEDALGGATLSQEGDEDIDQDEEYGDYDSSSSDEEGAEGMVDDTDWQKKGDEQLPKRTSSSQQKRKVEGQMEPKKRKKRKKEASMYKSPDRLQLSPRRQHESNMVLAKSVSNIVASLPDPQPTTGNFYSHAQSLKTRQKARDIFTDVFFDRLTMLVDEASGDVEVGRSYAVWLAFTVETATWEALGTGREYKEKVISLKHNLGSNTELCDAVLTRTVPGAELVKMNKEEMAGQEVRHNDSRSKRPIIAHLLLVASPADQEDDTGERGCVREG